MSVRRGINHGFKPSCWAACRPICRTRRRARTVSESVDIDLPLEMPPRDAVLHRHDDSRGIGHVYLLYVLKGMRVDGEHNEIVLDLGP
jgi:hypothetical protein